MHARLDHVHLFASDIDTTIDFWTRFFDAEIMYDTELVGSRNVRLDVGGNALHLYDQPPRRPPGGAVHHLGLLCEDLDDTVRTLTSRGMRFERPIRDNPIFRYTMCEAPDGVLLELYQPTPAGHWMISDPTVTHQRPR